MNLILLPGNSKKNKDWINQVEKCLGSIFAKTYIHNYQHWEDENESNNIDFELELENLVEATKDMDGYVVFAKSAGVLLALLGIKRGLLNPANCVFVGLAYSYGEKRGLDLDELFDSYFIPTLFIQKTFDPAIHFEELREFLMESNVRNYELVEIPGDDHHYENIAEIKDLIKVFLYE